MLQIQPEEAVTLITLQKIILMSKKKKMKKKRKALLFWGSRHYLDDFKDEMLIRVSVIFPSRLFRRESQSFGGIGCMCAFS